MNTILITGCSSGFGLETARYFLDRDWNVVATMRKSHDLGLPLTDRLRVLPLDVTDPASIEAVVREAGPIGALVNNAGIGWLNALEGTPMNIARDIFETNTLATLAMIQAFMPQFRERRAGVIVNITSSVTLKSLPLLSVYAASKAAVNALTECLAMELQPFNVRACLVLPGQAMETSFGASARARLQQEGGVHPAYAEQAAAIVAGWQADRSVKTTSNDVAEAVWRAVTNVHAPMRIPAGADAVALAGG